MKVIRENRIKSRKITVFNMIQAHHYNSIRTFDLHTYFDIIRTSSTGILANKWSIFIII